jgi:hypothetical protein
VASGAGASVAFSGFLRVVGRLMELFGLESLDAVLPRVAEEAKAAAANAAAAAAAPQTAADAGAGAAGSASMTASASASAVVHGQDLTGPLFRADVARRLTLPPVPVPRELLRSIFERFSVARMVGGGAGGGGSPRQSIVRGLPFSSWTAALAGAGVPVAPTEARELFRLLKVSLGELVSLAQLREAYLAIAGFRFLVTSGLFRDGEDMYAVVMSGRDVLGQVLLDARDVSAADGGAGAGGGGGGGGGGDDAVSDVSSDVGEEAEEGDAARRALDLGGEDGKR